MAPWAEWQIPTQKSASFESRKRKIRQKDLQTVKKISLTAFGVPTCHATWAADHPSLRHCQRGSFSTGASSAVK
jgi:hypothetical protein